MRKIRSWFVRGKFTRLALPIVVIASVASAGTYLLVMTHAAAPTVSQEAEAGTLAGNAQAVQDGSASGGQAVVFRGAVDPNQVLYGDPMAEQYPVSQLDYFADYPFPTSIDLMKITRDRSFPALNANVIQSDVQTFASQMPNANTMTDDVFFDNVQGFQAWADAIHAAGKHVWFRGHFCNWEPVPQCGNTTDHSPTDYANSLQTFLNNPSVQEAIQPGDIFDPCSEPVDQLGSDTADLQKILLYTTKVAHDTFSAQGKNVLVVHSLSESSFTGKAISDNVLLRSGGVITIDSYPEDTLSSSTWQNATTAAAAATQAWKTQLDQISTNYAQVMQTNGVKIMIAEAGFPNVPSGVSDAVKVAVNQSNFTMFMNYPGLAGTNYWVGPGDDNAGGHTYLFSPQTNFDSAGWNINAAGQAVDAVYGSKH